MAYGIDSNTVLCLRGDTFKDISSYNRTITNNGCGFYNAVAGKCIDVTGTSTLVFADSVFDINGNWTFEFDIYLRSATPTVPLMGNVGDSQYTAANLNCRSIAFLEKNESDTKYNYLFTSTASTTANGWDKEIRNVHNYKLNGWQHIAISKSGSSIRVFADGTLVGTSSNVGTLRTIGEGWNIGTWRGAATSPFYLRNFRISKVARYTANFTPPTKPYNSITIENLKVENDVLSCKVKKDTENEVIDKVDILVNGQIIKTFTSNFENISYKITDPSFIYGDNNIEVRAYYYGNYYESSTVSYNRKEINRLTSKTYLYLRGDSFTDLSPVPNKVVHTSPTINNGYIQLGGHDKKIEFPVIDMNTDWTIECNVIYDIVVGTGGDATQIVQPFIGTAGETTDTFCFSAGELKNSKLGTSISTNGTSWNYQPLGSTILSKNQLYHFAVVKEGSTVKTFLDGKLEINTTLSGNIKTYTYPFKLGYWRSTSNTATTRFTGKIKNFKITKAALYTADFNPSYDPSTSVVVSNIDVIESPENKKINIACNISKTSPNETISRVDIVANDKVLNSYSYSSESISYDINTSQLVYGENNIEVRAYYYENYYEASNVIYTKELNLEEFAPLEILPETTSLSSLIQHMSKIENANNAILNNLKTILEDKGFTIESPRLSTMVKLVKELDNNNSAEVTEYLNRITALENEKINLETETEKNKQSLFNKLIEKGVQCNNELSFNELINKIDELQDKQTSITLIDGGNIYYNPSVVTIPMDSTYNCTGSYSMTSSGAKFTITNHGLYAINYVVDLTNVSTIILNGTLTSCSNSCYMVLYVIKDLSTMTTTKTMQSDAKSTMRYDKSNTYEIPSLNSPVEMSLDVSNLKGNYNVIVGIQSSWYTSASCIISKVVLNAI